MKKNFAVLAVFVAVMVMALGISYAPAFAAPATPATSTEFGARMVGGEVEFFVSKSLVAAAIGAGRTPLFGGGIDGWSNNTPMSTSGDMWVARVKVGPHFSPGIRQPWGFWTGPGSAWGPATLYSNGLIPASDVVDAGNPGSVNFYTACK